MRIIDPQSAVLTNVEVLAYLSSNPPRRPPNPPPNARRNWVPSPDLRDHNTVVKEIHNYIARISPHILKYPRYSHRPSSSQSQSQAAMTGTLRANGTTDAENSAVMPQIQSSEPTPMDQAIRDLITKLKPYKLTKAELVMVLNLGLGVPSGQSDAAQQENGMANGDDAMEIDGGQVNGDGEEHEEGEGEDDGGAMALFDTVIEEREGRMTDEDVATILGIVRETLHEKYAS
ncbi:hypothetical protein N7532_004096 [Penicillium argentinense]|uniref:DNA-directed RNA polymerase III subunit RPC9 n=1 Tax=Penicillium argentinense TaxID=1131581 RepID=A0A9W9FP96_9EURO|nr:uncharacterized protein N7532_004096 [Penicillium argentinense]KAJ5103567.1 hypothetical protein N7532_004096 [Penicillium argentinense]